MAGEIRTARLRLAPFARGDAEALVGLYTDPRVMAIRKFGVLDRAGALEQHRRILDHIERHGFGLCAVRERDGGAFCGECGLRWLEDGSDVELSYGLLPAYRGRGYATEAARAALEQGFGELALDRVVALSRGDNRTSHRVLEKCGMRLLWRREPGERGAVHGLVKYCIDHPPYAARVVRAHRSTFPEPIALARGDRVRAGEPDRDHPGWLWTHAPGGRAGWAPLRVLDRDGGAVTVVDDYDATELDVEPGLEVTVLERFDGWGRVRAADGRLGWVPLAHLAPPPAAC